MKKLPNTIILCAVTLCASACSSSDDLFVEGESDIEELPLSESDPGGEDPDSENGSDFSNAILDVSMFRSMVSSTTVTCSLSNGSSTTCHELVFNVNEFRDGSGNGELVDDEAGAFCPSSATSNDGGVGIYDGDTNPGFQNLNATLWSSMAADGFDIIDEEAGLVCTQDPGSQESTGSNCTAFCLNAAADDNLTVTFLIPVVPEILNSPASIGSVEPIGASLDGVPITGEPPSVVNGPMGFGGGNIPSLDYCGGHHDPAGYYHWHLVPESADAVHEEFGTDEFGNCGTTITQDSTALTGFAKDGHPIYANQDVIAGTAVSPTDLDECNGHIGATEEFPDGVYHYHASVDAPNLPPCVIGASVDRRESPSFQ